MFKVHLSFPSSKDYIVPTAGFVHEHLLQISPDKNDLIEDALTSTLKLIIDNNGGKESITLDIFSSDQRIIFEIINYGTPVFFNNNNLLKRDGFKKYQEVLMELKVTDTGRGGQKFFIISKSGQTKDFTKNQSTKWEIPAEEIEIRNLGPGEEKELTSLFYMVYGYDYINESIYSPEKIKQMIQTGKLISTVAWHKEKGILGHVGLIKWNESPTVYEAALGAVDPRVKSQGLFKRLFTVTMQRLEKLSYQYMFLDFVTNHNYTQKHISKYNVIDSAIMVGHQSKKTQAKLEKLGIGKDSEEMLRYTILHSIKPGIKNPFGNHLYLPYSIGDNIDFMLEPLGLSWSPIPRFYPLPQKGDWNFSFNIEQQSIHFDFFMPGHQAVKTLLNKWSDFLKNGYQYASVDVPLDKPGLGILYDILAENGFFLSGLVPYKMGDQLCFRFQALTHTKVAFDDIKILSQNGKKLLSVIKDDYQRNIHI